jgi:hypothetical protein
MVKQLVTFRVYFLNLGWYSDETFTDLEAALAASRGKAFEFVIHGFDADEQCDIIVSWSPITGHRWHRRDLRPATV